MKQVILVTEMIAPKTGKNTDLKLCAGSAAD
jgi:hypothetical protein